MIRFPQEVLFTISARGPRVAFEELEENMQTKSISTSLIILVGLVTLRLPGFAQTIPEELLTAKKSFVRTVWVDGPPPSIDSLVKEAALIVRGTVGTPRTYLSQDKKLVYSDYPILNPTVIFPPSVDPSSRPGMATGVTVTHLGGKITIDGLSFDMFQMELPRLIPGIECLFLLKSKGDKYEIVGQIYGVFRMDGDKFNPLAAVGGFADDFREMRPADAVAGILALRRASP
jgi:hypothetical protein